MLSDKQQSFINTALPRMTIVEGCISSGKTFICNHKAVKHNIVDRITLENKLFAQDRLKINHKCHNMIKALKNAVWTDENAKDERMKDEKNNSHIIDAFEYAICTETANIEKAGHIDRR